MSDSTSGVSKPLSWLLLLALIGVLALYNWYTDSLKQQIAGQTEAIQQIPGSGRSRVGRIHDRDAGVEDGRDRLAQQWKMGASEDNAVGVPRGFGQAREVAADDLLPDGALVPAFLGKRDEQLARQLVHRRTRVEPEDSLAVSAEAHGRFGGQHEVPAARPRGHGRRSAGVDDANDRERAHLPAQGFQRDG